MKELLHLLQHNRSQSDLDSFRDRLVVHILRLLAVLGLFAVIVSLARGPFTGWRPLMGFHVGIYLLILGVVALSGKLSPRVQRGLLLGGLYVTGAVGIAAYGLLGAGELILLLFCSLSATLVNIRAGVLAIALTLATLAVIGMLAATGFLRFDVDPAAYLYSTSSWMFEIIIVLLASALSVLTAGALVQSLRLRYETQQRATEMMDALVRNSPDILALLDESGTIVFISHTEEGYHPPQELVGRRLSEVFAADGRQRLQAAIDLTLSTAQKVHIESTYQDPAGGAHPFDIHLAPVLREGQAIAVSVNARDMTAQRTTEAALRSERDLNAAVLETIGTLVVVLDTDGTIVYFNNACVQTTGYSKDEAGGRKVWDFLLTPEERPEVERVFYRITAGQFPNTHENDWVARDGTRLRIAWSNTVLTGVDGQISYVIATGMDVTRLIQTEAALVESEERLRLSQRYAKIGTWDWNIVTGALYWSDQIGPLFGFGEDVPETTYENFLKAIHPEDRAKVEDAVRASVEQDTRYSIEHRVVWPDGTVRWLLERGGTIRAANGLPLRMLGVVQDITERKEAETALAESEELFREFAENIEEVFWVRDLRSNLMIYVNPAYESIWGQSRESLLADPLQFLRQIHPDDMPEVREAMQRQQQGEYFNRRYRIRRPDGSIRWVHAQAFPIRDRDGTVYRIGGFVRDITRQQLADEERLHNERVQLQTLVREVHHRIKNHLQGVVGLLHSHVDRTPGASTPLREAIAQVRSIALVHGLQGQNLNAELHLCEMVPAIARSTMDAMSRPGGIEVTIDMGMSLRVADADVVPLALVINELLTNGLKHAPATPPRQPCRLRLLERQGVGTLHLLCPDSRLPERFKYERGIGLGTGLELVKALLPKDGAHLTIENTPQGVHCALTLQPPVVMPGSRVPATVA